MCRLELRGFVLRQCTALICDPRDANAWHELGNALVEAGDRAGGCVALRNALRLDPARAGTLRALGNLLFESGQFENALEDFERLGRARFNG